MQNNFNDELNELINQAIQSPHSDGCFRAILILLENSPDSRVIIDSLGKFDPTLIKNDTLRIKAADLLDNSDATEIAELWRPKNVNSVATNVVPLTEHTSNKRMLSTSDITFDDIGGLEQVKKHVRRKIINPFQNKKALFERFKRKAGGGVLMYGPPGCGKTMLAKALASECNARFFDVKAADILDQYVGNAEKRISQIFDEARSSRPVVLFFDEVEALAQRRQVDSSARVNTTVSTLLSEMDSFGENNEGMLFLGATNVPWSLDSAFRRPGRFDRSIFVPPPDKIARKFILNNLLIDRPTSTSLDIEKIVTKSMGFSGADLSALVDTAIDLAIEESPSIEELIPLSNEHFNEAFEEIKSSIGEWLAQARSFADYANESGVYDDLAAFLKKYAR